MIELKALKKVLSELATVSVVLSESPRGRCLGRVNLPGDLPYLVVTVQLLGQTVLCGYFDLV